MWKGILGVDLQEFLLYAPGQFMDIVACWQISQGIADEGTSEEEGEVKEYIPNWR